MAATLLYREMRTDAKHRRQDISCNYDDLIPFTTHLKTLERLVFSYPDKWVSASDGIEAFRDALKDGFILNK